MDIRFDCEKCDNQLEVPESSVGKKAKCPVCAHVMKIMQPQSQSHSEASLTREQPVARDESNTQTVPQPEINQPERSFASTSLPLDDRTLATIAHASGLVGMFTVGTLGFLGPLVIYLMYQQTSSFVASQAKEALNFQISLLLLTVAITLVGMVTCGIAIPLLLAVPAMQLIFGIIAPMQVWSGKSYRYPLTIRLVK